MAKAGQRKCFCCGVFFDSARRDPKRQMFCSATDCRRASNAASQARWLSGPANVGYFKDPAHVARTRAWREAHPSNARDTPRKAPALQDPLVAQANDSKEENDKGTWPVLQDLLNPPRPALAGLIAHLFGLTLQQDSAVTTRLLSRIGHEILDRASQASGDAVHEGRSAREVLDTARMGIRHMTP